MAKTRFMQAMFSAVKRGDEELAAQVAGDIEAAKDNGSVETDEVTYVNLGDGKVLIVDNENQEATIAEMAPDQAETYDLAAVPEEELDKFLHPLEDGITPDSNVRSLDTESSLDHFDPEAYPDPVTIEEKAKEFSVYTNNSAVLRVFQDQEFCERIFSEVIDSEDTAVVGNLKVEKCADSDDSIVITDETTGDQAKVTLDGDELEVTELDQKELSCYSECECEDDEEPEDNGDEYDPLFVVGIDPENHVIVDAPVYSEEDGQELIDKLSDAGVEGLEIFDSPFAARDHADALLSEEGVESEEDIDEPEEHNFSDVTIYTTRYYSDSDYEPTSWVEEELCTEFMAKLFSEAEEFDSETQEKIEDAIGDGQQVETDDEIITPIDAKTAVVEDKNNDEFTKVTLDGDELEATAIEEDEAEKLTKDVHVDDDEDEEDDDEKEFSWTEEEFCTDYMLKLYSESESEEELDEDSQEKIEDAIGNGKQVETDDEIITPVDSKTAVVEDKNNGEFTKVVLDGDELEATAIEEDEANDLLDDVRVDSKTDDEKEEDEKQFSEDMEMLGTTLKFFADAAPAPVAPGTQPQQVLPAPAPQVADQNAPVQEEQPVSQDDTTVTVEQVEDKALTAVQAISEAAQQAVQAIQQAKEAPVEEGQDLQEAQFSVYDDEYEYTPYEEVIPDTLNNWLAGI